MSIIEVPTQKEKLLTDNNNQLAESGWGHFL